VVAAGVQRVSPRTVLRWGGIVLGLPAAAAVYRRLTSANDPAQPIRAFTVRATIDHEAIADLAELVRGVRGRAVLEGPDTISVPLPDGAREDVAYRELRSLLERWELRYPGIRLAIVAAPVDRHGRLETFAARRRRTRRTAIDRVTRA
jgi:hypothetical protein